jgi:hypothetical protein
MSNIETKLVWVGHEPNARSLCIRTKNGNTFCLKGDTVPPNALKPEVLKKMIADGWIEERVCR